MKLNSPAKKNMKLNSDQTRPATIKHLGGVVDVLGTG
jgi:hypothetical protein